DAAHRRFQPRSEQELNRVRAIVSSAAGTDDARGDRVTVECVRFATTAAHHEQEHAIAIDYVAQAKSYGPLAIGALVLLIVLATAIVVLRRRRVQPAPQLEARLADDEPQPDPMIAELAKGDPKEGAAKLTAESSA